MWVAAIDDVERSAYEGSARVKYLRPSFVCDAVGDREVSELFPR
jgi:hypothetical protein